MEYDTMGPIYTMDRSRSYPQRRELVGGRLAGWYNRQYSDLGRVDMSYELRAGDGGGWVEGAGVPATLVLAMVPSCVTVYRSRVCVAEVSSSCSAAASLSPCHPALGVITSTPRHDQYQHHLPSYLQWC